LLRPSRALEAAFGEASLDGSVHALDTDGGAEVCYRSDEVWHSAPTGKVPILVALMRAVAAGEAFLRERARIPADGRTPGFSGLSSFTNPIRRSAISRRTNLTDVLMRSAAASTWPSTASASADIPVPSTQEIGAQEDRLRSWPHGCQPMSPASPRRLYRGARQHFFPHSREETKGIGGHLP